MSRTASSAFQRYISTTQRPANTFEANEVSPAMWNSGKVSSVVPGALMAAIARALLSGPAAARAATRSRMLITVVQWLRRLVSTPLGIPVVPEVYMIVAVSCGAGRPALVTSGRARCARSPSTGIAAKSSFPTRMLSTPRTEAGSSAREGRRRSRSASARISAGCASASSVRSSGAVRQALRGTATPPSNWTAQ